MLRTLIQFCTSISFTLATALWKRPLLDAVVTSMVDFPRELSNIEEDHACVLWTKVMLEAALGSVHGCWIWVFAKRGGEVLDGMNA